MKEILEEIRDMAEKNVDFPADKVLAHARSNTQEAMESDNDYARGLIMRAAGLLVVALENIDAEAATAQYREQARALLVAGHAAGYKYLTVWEAENRCSLEDRVMHTARYNFPLSAEPEPEHIEALARALQARKAKP